MSDNSYSRYLNLDIDFANFITVRDQHNEKIGFRLSKGSESFFFEGFEKTTIE